VDPFNGDYRQAIDLVKQFTGALLALPEVEAVNVLEYPLDTGSDSRLRGDTDRRDLKANFKLHVVIGDRAGESS
jgi:hypothetical protein